MVAFTVIGGHNWQTTAQGQPSRGSWRPASSPALREGRAAGMHGAGGWEVEQDLSLLGSRHKGGVLPFPSSAQTQASKGTHGQVYVDHHKQGTLFFAYAKTWLVCLVVLSPGIASIKETTMALPPAEASR